MSKLFTDYRNKFFQGAMKKQDLPPSVLKHLTVTEHIRRHVDPREAVYVVFDTELTGLNPKKDSIVSIGALKVFGTKIDIGNPYYRIVEPQSKLTGQSVVIHGITPSEASECPKIDKLLPEFLDFCGSGIIVGHFVSIDLAFLNKEMTRLFGLTLRNPSVDTCVLYQWVRKREENICAFHDGIKENVDLMTLAQKYSTPVFDAHNALNDAFITAQLLQRLIANLHRFNIKTVEDLLRIGKPRKKK
jgi:DNA polymerase-3 subunit epsilon